MIKKLVINNFKSIDGKLKPIKFKKLNVLCGENASGKTSIIHAILLCTQGKNNNRNIDGNIIKIGDYKELKNVDGSEIVISMMDENNKFKKITYKVNENVHTNQRMILLVEQSNDKSFEFERTVFYLSSNRAGTMDTYSKGNFIFGIDGANTVSFLNENPEEQMDSKYMKKLNQKYPHTSVSENGNLLEHVRFWMEKITGEQISINSVESTNQIVLTFGNKIRPINTGSGYSFLLPMIISTLGIILLNKSNENIPTLIIENPEIFLHPDAQCKLMEFFNFCKDFCQFIIETHSEYIVKSAVETNKTDTCIYVAKKENNSTRLYDTTNFKTNSYLEILYVSFGIITQDFHILLYGMAHNKFNNVQGYETSLRKFDTHLYDKYLNGKSDMLKKSEHKFYNLQTKQMDTTTYETLPTFIRNVIDHPGAKDPNSGQVYEYTGEELKKSIEFLLSLL